MSHLAAAMFGGSGEDQSRTWWEILDKLEGREARIEGWRLCVRISVASGRSVRRIWEGVGRVCRSVIPTMPQPAPSSRILRLGCERVVSSIGRRGNDESMGRGREAMYDDNTRPASLLDVS